MLHSGKVKAKEINYANALVVDFRTNKTAKSWMHDFQKIEEHLSKLKYHHVVKAIEYWHKFRLLRENLEDVAKKILQMDIQRFETDNLEQRVWKYCFYVYIGTLRERVNYSNSSDKSAEKEFLAHVINRGLKYFKELLSLTKTTYSVNLKSLNNNSRDDPGDKLVAHVFAVQSIYKIFIHLGDLHRYGNTASALREANECYGKARLCDPSKGRAYNQMGIVARLRSDAISVMYNLIRALAAKPPTDGVRIQLLILYDDTHKQYQAARNSYWFALSKKKENLVWYVRREIWILPQVGKPSDLPPAFDEDPPTKVDHVKSLIGAELFKGFSTTYIMFIGKLFTRIGLESLEEVAEESLMYFEELLKRAERLSFHRMIQIITLNMYIVHYVKPDSATMDMNQYAQFKYLEMIALQFGNEMFSIIVERFVWLINICDWDNPQLESIAACVQVWCNWLQLNLRLWTKRHPRPAFSIRRIELRRFKNSVDQQDDVWVMFAKLMTELDVLLRRYSSTLFPSVSSRKDDTHCISLTPLPECVTLLGLSNFANARIMRKEYFSDSSRNQNRGRNFIRFKTIHRFGCTLLTYTAEVLKISSFGHGVSIYQSIVKLKVPKKSSDFCGLEEENFHYWTHTEIESKPKTNRYLWPDCNNARIIVRKPKVKQISRAPVRLPMKNYVLWIRFCDMRYRTDIVVKPKRIVIDTNCFIQNLRLIALLLQIVPYPVYIPVSVVLELKGLKKGGFSKRDLERYADVGSLNAKEKLAKNTDAAAKAMHAILFVNTHFERFKIVTSTGRVVRDLRSLYENLRDDFYVASETNDDRILDTCKYMEVRDKDLRALDSPHRIYRNTVLITGDRNLRLKTFSLDIPTRDLAAVLFWASRYYEPRIKRKQRLLLRCKSPRK